MYKDMCGGGQLGETTNDKNVENVQTEQKWPPANLVLRTTKVRTLFVLCVLVCLLTFNSYFMFRGIGNHIRCSPNLAKMGLGLLSRSFILTHQVIMPQPIDVHANHII